MLKGKKILLCVTGGIAVFKAAALTSKLTQAGAIVKVMMSESAVKFVTPLTFRHFLVMMYIRIHSMRKIQLLLLISI